MIPDASKHNNFHIFQWYSALRTTFPNIQPFAKDVFNQGAGDEVRDFTISIWNSIANNQS